MLAPLIRALSDGEQPHHQCGSGFSQRMIAATPAQTVLNFLPTLSTHDELAARSALRQCPVVVCCGAVDRFPRRAHPQSSRNRCRRRSCDPRRGPGTCRAPLRWSTSSRRPAPVSRCAAEPPDPAAVSAVVRRADSTGLWWCSAPTRPAPVMAQPAAACPLRPAHRRRGLPADGSPPRAVLDDDRIPADRRVFMTATPVHTTRTQSDDGDWSKPVSVADEQVFGPLPHRRPSSPCGGARRRRDRPGGLAGCAHGARPGRRRVRSCCPPGGRPAAARGHRNGRVDRGQ